MRAVFVRIHDGQAVFKQAGRFVKVPLTDLAEEDAAIAQALSELAERRDWHDGEETVNGRFRGYNDGAVRVQVGAKTLEIPAVDLTAMNLDLVRTWARAFDRDDGQLPESARPSDFGKRPTKSAMSVDTMGEFGWKDVEVTGDERTWTNISGRRIVASLVRVEGKNVVLSRAGKEYTVPVVSLSSFDQEYVRGKSGYAPPAQSSPLADREVAQAVADSRTQLPTSSAGNVPPAASKQLDAAKPTTIHHEFDDAFAETVDQLMQSEPPHLDDEAPEQPADLPSKDSQETATAAGSGGSTENNRAANRDQALVEPRSDGSGKASSPSQESGNPSPQTSGLFAWLMASMAGIAVLVAVGAVLLKRRRRG